MHTKHTIVLSVLTVTLIFSIQSVEIVLASVQKLDASWHRAAMTLYFVSILPAAFIAPRLHRQLSRRKNRRLPRLFLLLGLTLLLAAGLGLSHWLHTEERGWWFLARSVCMGSLFAVAVYLFFANVPMRRQGLLLGTAVAVGDLCRILLTPVLHPELAVTVEPILAQYLHNLLAYLQIILVVVTAAAMGSSSVWFSDSVNRSNAAPALKNRIKESGNGNKKKGPFYFPKLSTLAPSGFIMLIVVFSPLTGLVDSLFFPNLNPPMRVLENPHILGLLIIPLAGLMLDIHGNRGAKRLLIAVACLFTAAPALALFTANETHDALFSLFFIGRQTFFITMMVVAARRFGDKSYALFACCAAHIFQSLSYFANWAGKAILADTPYALCLAAFFLALLFACLAARLRWPPDSPDSADLADLADQGAVPGGNTEALDNRETSKLRVDEFIRAHNLSVREVQIMEQLTQGRSTNEMMQNMNLKESTIRSYVNRVLKKTKTNSRLELVSVISAIKESRSF